MSACRAGFPRQAAVLGAGAMGSQIAAHLANAGIHTLLYDLPETASPDAGARRAIERLAGFHPPPLALPERAHCIEPLNYADHLQRLRDCDLIIEAIPDRLDGKQGFYARITPYIGRQVMLLTTTSCLSVRQLAEALPENRRANFCGAHFFDPPRYRRLVEIVPHDACDPDNLARLERFMIDTLGKQVVRAKDSPNFIVNRIGLMALLTATHHADRFSLAPDLTDALTRAAFALEPAAVYGTLDEVGPTYLQRAIDNIRQALPGDDWFATLDLPAWLPEAVEGVYRGGRREHRYGDHHEHHAVREQHEPAARGNRPRQVFDPLRGVYRDVTVAIHPTVRAALQAPELNEQLLLLRACNHPQARFLWASLRDVLHYSAVWLTTVADSVSDLDLAMRVGFGWRRGPFELWQAGGWKPLREWLEQDRAAGRTLSATPLPDWVYARDRVYGGKGAFAPALARCVPVMNTGACDLKPNGEPLLRSGPLTLWEPEQPNDGSAETIAVLSLADDEAGESGRPVDPEALLPVLRQALARAAASHAALILWTPAPYFFCGPEAESGTPEMTLPAESRRAERRAAARRQICQALRAAPLPVIAAVHGRVADDGLALMLHCDRSIAALETRFELSAPHACSATLCNELARRAAAAAGDYPLVPLLQPYFDWLTGKRRTGNALAAQKLGLLTTADKIIMQPRRLLRVALAEARTMADTGYRPPPRLPVKIAGRAGVAALAAHRAETPYNGSVCHQRYLRTIAEALCGAAVDERRVEDQGQVLGDVPDAGPDAGATDLARQSRRARTPPRRRDRPKDLPAPAGSK